MAASLVPPRSDIPTENSLEGGVGQPDLLGIASTPITHAIPDAIIAKALAIAPFVPISGALNLRDLGLLKSPTVKPGLIYRSGALHTLPKNSVPLLKSQLNLSKIYDLCTEGERKKRPDPEVSGVEAIWLDYTEAPPRAVPADFKANGGIDGYAKMYDDVLKAHAKSYKTVLTHLRDQPGEPILYHCASGKDRTGVISAIILAIAGQSPEDIANDYVLTRIGIETERAMLTESLKQWLGEDAMEQDGVLELSSISTTFMIGFLDLMGERYGGPIGYCKSVLGFTDEDLDIIRGNISVT